MFDLDALNSALDAYGKVARVVIAAEAGSVPREVGTSMLVWDGGQSGTIGGGTLELTATEAALQLIAGDEKTRVSRLSLGPNLGQCCGGAVTLITEVFTRSDQCGTLAPLTQQSSYIRRVEGAATPALAIHRAEKLARAQGQQSALIFEDGWIYEPLVAHRNPLWIWGAGHVGRAMVGVFEPLPDFDITWIDTDQHRFPDRIPETVTQMTASTPAKLVKYAPANTQHLILTFSHDLDLEICHQLLSHQFSFAGLIGSQTKWARFKSRLHALGHANVEIERITCPIGEPALGKHPQTIAISVAAGLLVNAQSALTPKERIA